MELVTPVGVPGGNRDFEVRVPAWSSMEGNMLLVLVVVEVMEPVVLVVVVAWWLSPQ